MRGKGEGGFCQDMSPGQDKSDGKLYTILLVSKFVIWGIFGLKFCPEMFWKARVGMFEIDGILKGW